MLESLEALLEQVRDAGPAARLALNGVTVAGALGIVCVCLVVATKLLIGFQLYVVNQLCFRRNLVKKYGQWAVVSGATDGIGLALARQFAQRGFSVLVIGRNKEKLARTSQLLEAEPNVGQVETALVDLSDWSAENFERLRSQLDADNRDIGVLVNNAGLVSLLFSRFGSSNLQDIQSLVNVNILATVYLTRLVLPGMVGRQRGLILNVSSQNSYLTLPYWSVYGPTKAFVNSFSRHLQLEYSKHPIDIVNLTPGLVHTNLLETATSVRKSSLMCPSATSFAASTVNALSTPVASLCGWLAHDVVLAVGKRIQFTGIPVLVNNLAIKMMVRDLQVSPVPQRRRCLVQNGFRRAVPLPGAALKR